MQIAVRSVLRLSRCIVPLYPEALVESMQLFANHIQKQRPWGCVLVNDHCTSAQITSIDTTKFQLAREKAETIFIECTLTNQGYISAVTFSWMQKSL